MLLISKKNSQVPPDGTLNPFSILNFNQMESGNSLQKMTRMVFKGFIQKWHVDRARDSHETSTLNRNRSRKSTSSSLILDKALRGHTDREEELAMHALSVVFNGMTTVLSDFRKTARISFFDAVGYLFVNWSCWVIYISVASVDI